MSKRWLGLRRLADFFKNGITPLQESQMSYLVGQLETGGTLDPVQKYTNSIIAVQNALTRLGKISNFTSGVMTQDVSAALNDFRGTVGLPKNGPVSAADLMALATAVQSAPPSVDAVATAQAAILRAMTPEAPPPLPQPEGVVTLPSGAAAVVAASKASGLPGWVLPVAGGLVVAKMLKLW